MKTTFNLLIKPCKFYSKKESNFHENRRAAELSMSNQRRSYALKGFRVKPVLMDGNLQGYFEPPLTTFQR